MPDYIRVLENAIQFGDPVLLQNVQEEIDPSLNPVLDKSLTRIGGRLLLKLGDKESEYNPEFRFYITTKLSNRHFLQRPPQLPPLSRSRLLNEASGSLLDDAPLVNTLQASKVTASKVSEQLESSEQAELKINSA
ncbi:dynein heavy chain 2, axonemal [Fundulus heteroclitus]|uniref:dynein heavy chain 2, axonemal n=1 Tax=Fundulus heteroclitus TaxID=8078 RepID=UPI00165CC828|nr:dynein heavy chain 2, axonemal [Fundulus heteroclitus]